MKRFPGSPPIPHIERDPDRDLAGALHEVSNALTVVLGWLDRAREEPPQSAEALEQAYGHAALGHSIARRAVGAPLQADGEPVSSLHVLQSGFRGVSPVAASQQVRLTLGPGQADVPVAHPAALQQVLLNLLLNAISFSPQGGSVRLYSLSEAGRLTIRVQDEGPGVAPEKRQDLFKPGGSMRPGGAGLGLAHSHSLAESRGGELRLLDADGGACFEVDWPVATESESEAKGELQALALGPRGVVSKATVAPESVHDGLPPSVLEASSRRAIKEAAAGDGATGASPHRVRLDGLRVVALEDDSAVSSLLEFSLRGRGVDLVLLETQQQLKAFIERRTPADVALVDLSPLGDQASELLARLSRQQPDLDIFIISGCVTMRDLGVTVRGWIRKPFDMPELIDALASTIDGQPRSAGGL